MARAGIIAYEMDHTKTLMERRAKDEEKLACNKAKGLPSLLDNRARLAETIRPSRRETPENHTFRLPRVPSPLKNHHTYCSTRLGEHGQQSPRFRWRRLHNHFWKRATLKPKERKELDGEEADNITLRETLRFKKDILGRLRTQRGKYANRSWQKSFRKNVSRFVHQSYSVILLINTPFNLQQDSKSTPLHQYSRSASTTNPRVRTLRNLKDLAKSAWNTPLGSCRHNFQWQSYTTI